MLYRSRRKSSLRRLLYARQELPSLWQVSRYQVQGGVEAATRPDRERDHSRRHRSGKSSTKISKIPRSHQEQRGRAELFPPEGWTPSQGRDDGCQHPPTL